MAKINRSSLSFFLLISASVPVLLAVANAFFQVPFPLMTRDVSAIAGINPLYGFASSLGILLWGMVASVCGFTALVLKDIASAQVTRFLFASSALSVYLLLDDLFLIHESLAQTYLGVDENMVYIMLGLAVCIYLLAFNKLILASHYGMLLIAFIFLGSSVVVDTLLQPWARQLGDWSFFIEDGAKWVGIVAWGMYYLSTCYQFLSDQLKA